MKKMHLKLVHQKKATKLYSRIKIAVKTVSVQLRAKATIPLKIKFKDKEKAIGNAI